MTSLGGREGLDSHATVDRIIEEAISRPTLPVQYEPFVQQYQQIARTVQEGKEPAAEDTPWQRDVATLIGNSTYLKNVSPLFGYFWLSWQGANGAIMLLADLALIIYAYAYSQETQMAGVHEFSTVQVVEWIGVSFYIPMVLPITTWIFGYIGPRESTYTAHVVVAALRTIVCIACFAQIYFRTDLGVVRPIAIKLVLILVVASLFHLFGACIRIVHFAHDRIQALRNPADRRIHQGNGFMISYPSLETQEKHKAAARATVGIHKAYAETLDTYWHYPTPEVDFRYDSGTEDVKWWQRLWKSRSPLQRHAKRVAYMRRWPLNFETPTVLQNDVFAPCDCCLNSDPAPQSLMSRPKDQERLRTRRNQFLLWAQNLNLQQPAASGRQGQSREESGLAPPDQSPDPFSVPLHQLCGRCQSLRCESKMLGLLSAPSLSQFWRHMQSIFAFTHTGSLLEEKFILWESAIALRDSASTGCHLCSMIWDSLSPVQQAALVREVNSYANTDYPQDLGVFVKILSPYTWKPDSESGARALQHLYLVAHFGPRRVPRFWLEQKFALRAQSLGRDPVLDHPELLPPIQICLIDPADTTTFFPASSSSSTDSDVALNFMKRWLSAHQHAIPDTSHKAVAQRLRAATETAQPREPARPNRLLEILPDHRVRLVSKMPPQFKAPYVALSYCWHSTHNCVLEKKTLSHYAGGVAFHDLPYTIQDALRISMNLGFSYIWIDALCIIQDSGDDKIEELKAMQGIYAGAAFVIAAAAAMDSSQAFVVDQMPHAMSACFLDLDQELKASKDGIRLPLNSSAIVALPGQRFSAAAEYELSLSRLRSRAWVYQEEELAARVLYFGDRQLTLRCNLCRRTAVQQYLPSQTIRKLPNTIWPESVLVGSMIASVARSLQNLGRLRGKAAMMVDSERAVTCASGQLNSIRGQRFVNEEDIRPSTQQERWWALVREYTARHLSYEADKLPAIQGLADRFESELLASQGSHPDEPAVRYISGLWSGSAFTTGLLWYVRDGISVRPDSRSPSWSWAAVDGVIDHNSLTGNTHVDACGISVLSLPDTHDGSVVLRGVIKPATWHRAQDDRRIYYVGHPRAGSVRFQHDLNQYEPVTSDLSQGPEARILRDKSGRDIGYLLLDSESELSTEGSEVHCLRIIVKPATSRDEHDFNVPWATRGLALVKDTGDSSRYRRIGYIEMRRTPGGISYRSSMNPAKQKAERNPPPNIDVAGFFADCEATTVAII